MQFKMANTSNTFSVRLDGREDDSLIKEVTGKKLGRVVQRVNGKMFIPFDPDGHEWHKQWNKKGVVHWSKGWGASTQSYASVEVVDSQGDNTGLFGATPVEDWKITEEGILLTVPDERNPVRHTKRKGLPAGSTTEDRAIECLQELAAFYNGPGLSISQEMYDLLGRTLMDLMIEFAGGDDGEDDY